MTLHELVIRAECAGGSRLELAHEINNAKSCLTAAEYTTYLTRINVTRKTAFRLCQAAKVANGIAQIASRRSDRDGEQILDAISRHCSIAPIMMLVRLSTMDRWEVYRCAVFASRGREPRCADIRNCLERVGGAGNRHTVDVRAERRRKARELLCGVSNWAIRSPEISKRDRAAVLENIRQAIHLLGLAGRKGTRA